MSVVVAVKDGKGGVWMACDSQVTQYNTAQTLSNKNNYKIFRINNCNNAIMGVVGYLRDRDILYCADNLLDELAVIKDKIDYKYMVKTFVPNLFDIFINNRRLIKDNNKPYQLDDAFILAYKDKVFSIGGDGSVIEVDDYCAVGSGQFFSQGALNLYQNDRKQLAIDAVKSACQSDIFVNYPIILMNTRTNDVEIIKG